MDWDLTDYFPRFGGTEYRQFVDDLANRISGLSNQVDTLSSDDAAAWADFIEGYEELITRFSHVRSYVSCLAAAEADKPEHAREEAALASLSAQREQLADKFMRRIGSLDEDNLKTLLEHPGVKGLEYALARLRKQASERMSPEEESLGSDLGINGLGAWSRLYFSLMGNLRFTMEDPEMGTVEKPVAQLNSLLADQNAERRKAASAGAALTFSEHRVTCAAAINAISGTRLTLNQRRSVKHFLEPSCFQSAISTETLEALMQAVDSRLPFAREVFQFRSKKLGIEKPGFLDLRAPLPADASAKLDWASATTLVSNAFNKVYPALGAFFDELIEKCWVDHTPRDGKRPGGFCTGSLMTRQSRIFMTYNATLNDVLTLAHEAGHAWHSRVLKDQRPLRSGYPMTLAETASTLAERVLTQGIMDDPQSNATTRLHLLDAEIEHGLAFLLDLPVRFRFERRLYELRANGQLSAEELCSLMRETQIEVFGGAMDPDGADPWFWVAKLHFYIEQVQFYNYPYTFGFLLSLAFMDGIREDPVSGISAYEAFLAESGSQSCEDVVKATLGADIADPAFWEARIDSLRTPFAHYKDLLQ